MRIEPVQGEFVARVSDVQIDGDLPVSEIEELTDALDRHLVLVFPHTHVDDVQFTDFGRCFGELEDFAFASAGPKAVPAVSISNLDTTGSIRQESDPARTSIAADALWHTDNSYRPKRARYSMLVARTIPAAGGGTEFCDTRAAYASLPEDVRDKIEGLVAEHSIIHSRELVGFTGVDARAASRAQPRRPAARDAEPPDAPEVAVPGIAHLRDPRLAHPGHPRPGGVPHRFRDPTEIRLRTLLASR